MSNLFLSSGEDPYAHLRQYTTSVPRAPFEGLWSTLELQLDAFSRQRYTVGVAVSSVGRELFAFRLLDDLVKFECLFGREEVAAIHLMIESVERSLLRAQKEGTSLGSIIFDTPAALIGDPWPTSGTSLETVLGRLFLDVVPFLPRDEKKTRDFLTLDNAAVRRLVDNELKRIAGLSFEGIVTEPHRAVLDQDTREPHWLDFNLEPSGKAGSVISAVYKTPTNVELNFLRASRDLSTYARVRNLKDRQLGLFVMTPSEDSMSPVELSRIESILAEQSWNLEQQGFVVAAHDSPALIAQEVWEWAAVDH